MRSTFDVLADPTRRELLEHLRAGECSVGVLVDRMKMSQPAISKHLRILRDAGMATVRRDAQRRLYRLQPDGLREMDEWLAPFREFWAHRVDALEEVLNEMED